jgi:hypothetical protein
VQYTADGPFWAMAAGNKFLRPWQNLCRFHIFVFLKFFTYSMCALYFDVSVFLPLG